MLIANLWVRLSFGFVMFAHPLVVLYYIAIIPKLALHIRTDFSFLFSFFFFDISKNCCFFQSLFLLFGCQTNKQQHSEVNKVHFVCLVWVGQVSHAIHFGSKKHPKFGWASFVEPRWLSYTCCGHQKSFPVWLTNTPLVPLHREGAFKTICLLGCSFMDWSCTIEYCVILFKSLCSPLSSTPSFFLAHPWLNNQKKVTFLRSDFHACSMLGRHFRFPKTFHVTHPSTQRTASTLLQTTMCNFLCCCCHWCFLHLFYFRFVRTQNIIQMHNVLCIMFLLYTQVLNLSVGTAEAHFGALVETLHG